MSDSLKDFVAGTAGGFAGKLLDYPLDTVKVLLQTQETSGLRYRGAWHCLTHTVETKGLLSLYRGLSSPLLGSMAENALLFWAYNHCQRFLLHLNGYNDKDGQKLSLFQQSLAGAGAGAVVPFVLTPVELIKCRLQVQNHDATGFRVYKGPMDVIVQTVRTEGIARGLYRGHASTLLREIPGNFVWYGLYEGVCMTMIPQGGTKDDLGPAVHLLGGGKDSAFILLIHMRVCSQGSYTIRLNFYLMETALAGVGYWTAFYPADTVKSMVQTNPDHMGRGFVETFLSVYRTQGIRGLYRGWGVTAARAAPAHAAIFAVYEYTMKMLKSPDGPPPKNDRYGMHEAIRD